MAIRTLISSILLISIFSLAIFAVGISTLYANDACVNADSFNRAGCVERGHDTDSTRVDIPSQLNNPLKATSITQFLAQVIDVILIFAVPVVVFFIIFAGFLFVTAQGNQEKLSKAKGALMWAIVGGLLVLGAKVILTVIQGTVSAF